EGSDLEGAAGYPCAGPLLPAIPPGAIWGCRAVTSDVESAQTGRAPCAVPLGSASCCMSAWEPTRAPEWTTCASARTQALRRTTAVGREYVRGDLSSPPHSNRSLERKEPP